MAVELHLFCDDGWLEVKDGDESVRTIFDNHYSRYVYADGRRPKLFIGPGEKLVLMTADCGAICAWRREKPQYRLDGEIGVNCAIFRRESGEAASGLLREAMRLAWLKWPGERLFTMIDPRFVPPTYRASRPTWGHCFYQTGWTFVRVTKKGQHVLEAFDGGS